MGRVILRTAGSGTWKEKHEPKDAKRSIFSNKKTKLSFSLSVQFRRSVMSDSLQTHGLKHTSSPVLHYPPEFDQAHVH